MTFAGFRRLCLAQPEAEERETWGETTFRVRGRIFAMGSPGGRLVSIKASLDDQAGLIALDPKTFSVSAYTGRFGWVTVRLSRLRADLGERLVRNAWDRTVPRRISAAAARGTHTAALDAAQPRFRREVSRSSSPGPRTRRRARG